jgi:hypothetical protein
MPYALRHLSPPPASSLPDLFRQAANQPAPPLPLCASPLPAYLQVLHCVMYPRLQYDLPILSMDLVANDGRVSLAIVDPCPVSATLELPPFYDAPVRWGAELSSAPLPLCWWGHAMWQHVGCTATALDKISTALNPHLCPTCCCCCRCCWCCRCCCCCCCCFAAGSCRHATGLRATAGCPSGGAPSSPPSASSCGPPALMSWGAF